jgi:hypothetical protein
MKWLNFSDDILDNIEIQVHLDVYAKENQYSMISSFRKKKDKKRILSNINDYQAVLIIQKFLRKIRIYLLNHWLKKIRIDLFRVKGFNEERIRIYLWYTCC